MPGVHDWLQKASNDLQASKLLADHASVLDCSVFHTHQCAEKAYKAFIVLTQQPIPKTHDLGALLVRCAAVDLEFMLLQEESTKLNSFGLDARYPNDHFYVNHAAATEAIGMAEKIFYVVQKKVSLQQAHP